MDEAAARGQSVVISSISLAEIVYLNEKNGLPASVYQELRRALDDPEYVIEEVPFNGEIVEAMRLVPREDVPDMPDRIVAATAVYFGVPLSAAMAAYAPAQYRRSGDLCCRAPESNEPRAVWINKPRPHISHLSRKVLVLWIIRRQC